MTMTIAVYRLNPETRAKTILCEKYTVTGNEPLPPTSSMLPCLCEPCLEKRATPAQPQ